MCQAWIQGETGKFFKTFGGPGTTFGDAGTFGDAALQIGAPHREQIRYFPPTNSLATNNEYSSPIGAPHTLWCFVPILSPHTHFKYIAATVLTGYTCRTILRIDGAQQYLKPDTCPYKSERLTALNQDALLAMAVQHFVGENYSKWLDNKEMQDLGGLSPRECLESEFGMKRLRMLLLMMH